MAVTIRSGYTAYRRGRLTLAGHGGVNLNDMLLAAGSTVPDSWVTTQLTGAAHWTLSTTTSPVPNSTGVGAVLNGSYSFQFDAIVSGSTVATITLPATMVADCYTVAKSAEIDSTTTGLRAPSVQSGMSGKRVELARFSERLWGSTPVAARWSTVDVLIQLFGTDGVTSTTPIYTTPLVFTSEDQSNPFVATKIYVGACADLEIAYITCRGQLNAPTYALDTTTNLFHCSSSVKGITKTACARLYVHDIPMQGTNDAMDGGLCINAVQLFATNNSRFYLNNVKGVNQVVTIGGGQVDRCTFRIKGDTIFSDGLTSSPSTPQFTNCIFEYCQLSNMAYTPKNDGVHSDFFQSGNLSSSNTPYTGNILRFNEFDINGSACASQAFLLSAIAAVPHQGWQIYCNIARITKPIGINLGFAAASPVSFIKNNTIVSLGADTSTFSNAAKIRKATLNRGGLYLTPAQRTVVGLSGATGSVNHVDASIVCPAGTKVRAPVDKTNPIVAGTPFALSSGNLLFTALQDVPANTPPTNATYTGGGQYGFSGGDVCANPTYWAVDLTTAALPQTALGAPLLYDTEGEYFPPKISTSDANPVLDKNVVAITPAIAGTSTIGTSTLAVDADFANVNCAVGAMKTGFVPVGGGAVALAGTGALNTDGSWNIPAGLPTVAPTSYLLGLLNLAVQNQPITINALLDNIAVSDVTITLAASGVAGGFSSTTILIPAGSVSGTATYTPTAAGTLTLSSTNNASLPNPSPSIVSVSLAANSPTTITASVVSTSVNGFAPLVVTYTLDKAAVQAVTIAPYAGSFGIFSSDSLIVPVGATSATVLYAPRVLGSNVLTSTNDRGLANPSPLTLTVGRLNATKAAMRRCGIRV